MLGKVTFYYLLYFTLHAAKHFSILKIKYLLKHTITWDIRRTVCGYK